MPSASKDPCVPPNVRLVAMLIPIVGPLIICALIVFAQVSSPARPAARLNLAKSTTRTVLGIVRAHRTRKPLAGIAVSSSDGGNATTSASGVFRIDDLPIKSFYFVDVCPDRNQPYVQSVFHARAEENSMPLVVNIELTVRRTTIGRRPARIASIRRLFPRLLDDCLSKLASGVN
jgi:hypothetical protein